MGSGCIDPHFLDLGTSWRWVDKFTPRPLYPRGKNPRYPLDRRLGGPQSRSGRFGEEKIFDPTVKVKLSLQQVVKAHRGVRLRGSQIFSRQSTHRWRWGWTMHIAHNYLTMYHHHGLLQNGFYSPNVQLARITWTTWNTNYKAKNSVRRHCKCLAI
jgi:hypothetical protein